MKKVIKSKLTLTKWGFAISLKDKLDFLDYPGDRIAFLSYPGNHSDFNTDTIYDCEIFYNITYAKKPNKSKKEWCDFDRDSIKEICAHSDFTKYKLKKEKIQPYFQIK